MVARVNSSRAGKRRCSTRSSPKAARVAAMLFSMYGRSKVISLGSTTSHCTRRGATPRARIQIAAMPTQRWRRPRRPRSSPSPRRPAHARTVGDHASRPSASVATATRICAGRRTCTSVHPGPATTPQSEFRSSKTASTRSKVNATARAIVPANSVPRGISDAGRRRRRFSPDCRLASTVAPSATTAAQARRPCTAERKGSVNR